VRIAVPTSLSYGSTNAVSIERSRLQSSDCASSRRSLAGVQKATTMVAVGTTLGKCQVPHPEPSPASPARGIVGGSAFRHEPLRVRDHRGCERHRSGRTVDTLKAGMLEAARPRAVDPDHFPNRRRRVTHPDASIALPSFDLSACTHDDPFCTCTSAPPNRMKTTTIVCCRDLPAFRHRLASLVQRV
jgi:hypothetical protein